MSTTTDDLLFTEQIRAEGMVSDELIDEVLEIQQRVADMGVPDQLGSLMIKRGLLKPEQVEAIYSKIRPLRRKRQIEGYQLVRRLGQGGMASVFLARQDAMDRHVALKILKPSLTRDPQQLERLRREAQVVGRLSHPNIVRGLEFGESNGFHFFAMEYVEGETIRDRLKSGRRFREKEALRITREIAEALDHAFHEGVTHRDVKPGNVMLMPEGTAMLMDYGLAKAPIDGSLTQTGSTLGTPQYIAPEQARSPKDADIRSDLYSLGATLYHMVTGRPAFDGENLAEIVTKVLMKPHDPPQALNPKLSRDTAFLIDKLMAKDPRQRQQTPRELIRDIDRITSGKGLAPATWEGDWHAYVLKRKMRRVMGVVAIVVLAAVGAIVYMVVESNRRTKADSARAASDARYAAMQAEQSGSFESIPVIAELWSDAANDHGGLIEEASERAAFWSEAEKVQVLVITAMGRADARGAFAFKGRFADLEPLLPESKVHPWIETALEGRIRALTKAADAEAKVRLERIDDDRRLDFEARGAALSGLLKDLGENWPDHVAMIVRERASQELKDVLAIRQAHVLLDDRLRGFLATYAGERVAGAGRYRQVNEEIGAAIREVKKALEENRVLDRLPKVVSDQFASVLERLVSDVRDRDTDACLALRQSISEERARRVNDPALFASWVETLKARAEVALRPESREEYKRVATELECETKKRRGVAAKEFATVFGPFRNALVERRYGAAAAFLETFHERSVEWGHLAIWVSEDLDAGHREVAACRRVFVRAREAIVARRGTVAQFRNRAGVGTGKSRVIRVEQPSLEGTTIYLKVGDRESTIRLFRLAHGSVLEWAGLSGTPDSEGDRQLAGLFRLIEERSDESDLRRERRRFEEIHRLVLKDPRYRSEIEQRIVVVTAGQAKRESEAKSRFVLGREALRENKPERARDIFNELLDRTEPLRHTRYVDQNQSQIERALADSEREIKNDETSRLYRGGRFEYFGSVEGLRRLRTRGRLEFVFDSPRSTEDFRIAPERVIVKALTASRPIVAAPRSVDGPIPAAGPINRTVLMLKQGDGQKDLLEHHPLVLDSPFRAQDVVTVDVDVMSPLPVFFAISIGGACVGILSQDETVEGGRGVGFWLARDVTGADGRRAFFNLRLERVRGRIERTTDADKRRRLEESTYFRMLPNRWYRVRFVKSKREATLEIDGRLIARFDFEGPSALRDKRQISFLTYTTTYLDNLSIAGVVDPDWYARNH